MTPTRDELDVRDLLQLANACADAGHLPRRADGSHDLEAMFGRSRAKAPAAARRAFYVALVREHDWPVNHVAAFVGRDHSSVFYAVRRAK